MVGGRWQHATVTLSVVVCGEASVRALCQHTHPLTHSGTCVYWQPLKPAHATFASSTSLPPLRLHGNYHHPPLATPRLLVGQSRDLTWRQDGAERRHSSGGHRLWIAGIETRKDNWCGVGRRFLSQRMGGAHSWWTRRRSASRQWTRLHQPRTSKQLHHCPVIQYASHYVLYCASSPR